MAKDGTPKTSVRLTISPDRTTEVLQCELPNLRSQGLLLEHAKAEPSGDGAPARSRRSIVPPAGADRRRRIRHAG